MRGGRRWVAVAHVLVVRQPLRWGGICGSVPLPGQLAAVGQGVPAVAGIIAGAVYINVVSGRGKRVVGRVMALRV